MANTEEVMKRNLRRQIPTLTEDFRFAFEYADKFIVWIIGSDVAGIALLISNSGKFICTVSKSIPYVVVILFISIICGIVYKLLSMPLLARWNKFIGNYMAFTTPTEDYEIDEDDVDPTFMIKLKEFMHDKLGLTEKKWDKIAASKKTVYPQAFTANKFFLVSIYLFLLAFAILIVAYII